MSRMRAVNAFSRLCGTAKAHGVSFYRLKMYVQEKLGKDFGALTIAECKTVSKMICEEFRNDAEMRSGPFLH